MGITAYHVYRHIRLVGTNESWYRYGEPIAILAPSDRTYTDTGVTGVSEYETEYTYAVAAVKSGNIGLLSDQVKLRRGIDEDGNPYVEVTINTFGPP